MEWLHVGGTPEAHRVTFEKAIEDGIIKALTVISQRFEYSENPLDNLAFHNTQHTKGVIERTKKILEAMGATDRLVRLGEFIAANHDTVQEYEITVDANSGVKKRSRFIEKNEDASADEAIAFMRTYPSIFDEEDMETVREAIQATIPGFDMGKRTVIQPNLLESIDAATVQERLMTSASELVTRALALADLGTAGMEEPDSFVHDGDAIFREENIDVLEALQHLQSLSDVQKETFMKRMLDWTTNQIAFAQGREASLDKELEGLPEDMERSVRKLFTHFDANIQRAQSKVDRRKLMTFEELVRDFGYEI